MPRAAPAGADPQEQGCHIRTVPEEESGPDYSLITGRPADAFALQGTFPPPREGKGILRAKGKPSPPSDTGANVSIFSGRIFSPFLKGTGFDI